MKKLSRAQFLSTAAPLLTLSSAGLLAQGGDTPIIIADGSLKMQSVVPWPRYNSESNRRRVHPNAGSRLTSVELRLAGGASTVAFDNQRCEVVITYAGLDITLFTNPTGRNLKVDTDWARFSQGASDSELLHENQGSKISRVVVRRDGNVVADQSLTGCTQIILHYSN